MRVRFDKNAQELLNKNEIHINNPNEFLGKWKKCFSNNNRLYLEIGIGKGDFIVEMAKRNQDINFIGIEKNVSILAKALKKVEKERLKNIRLISYDASNLKDIFKKGEIDKIYLNFSDPWPKNKHYKRRLTYSSFLDIYDYILSKDGVVEFKTDNKILFEFTIMEIANTKRQIEYISLDLHSLNLEDNIMTEYEEKFSKKGNKIYKLVWKNAKFK